MPLLYLYAFRYKDALTGKWVQARYRATIEEIRERYAESETIGEPEIREPSGQWGLFGPRDPSDAD